MEKSRLSSTLTLLAALAVTAMLSGCFTTKVYSRGQPAGPVYSERQWFALGGLVDLSRPAGSECQKLALAESKLAAMDVVINVGLGVAGSIIAASSCAANDSGCRSAASLGGSLLPWMLGTRTVEYRCAE